jgi:hypothetical protein
VTAALTLPAETILLHALTTPSTQQAARTWVTSLTDAQTSAAASVIQSYPFAYRREIMRRLSPQQRSAVWQGHIKRYIAAHPGLDASTAALLYNAASLATPAELSAPTDATRTQISIIADQIKVLLGKSQADYLFYRLGPADNSIATAAPIAEQLADFVRNHFVVQARTEDCDCSRDFGCDGGAYCSGALTCNRDDEWPMCGWFWTQVCDGLCVAGIG